MPQSPHSELKSNRHRRARLVRLFYVTACSCVTAISVTSLRASNARSAQLENRLLLCSGTIMSRESSITVQRDTVGKLHQTLNRFENAVEKLTDELKKAHIYVQVLSTNLQELEDACQNEVLKNQEQLTEAKNEIHSLSLLLEETTNCHIIVADNEDSYIPNESIHPLQLGNAQQQLQATGSVELEKNTANESINGVIGDTGSLPNDDDDDDENRTLADYYNRHTDDNVKEEEGEGVLDDTTIGIGKFADEEKGKT